MISNPIKINIYGLVILFFFYPFLSNDHASDTKIKIISSKPPIVSIGSTAVILTRTDSITVATDSRASIEGVIQPDTTCKIFAANNIVFFHVGVLRSPDSPFDVFDFASRIVIEPTTIQEKLNKFEPSVHDFLWSILNFKEHIDSVAISEYFRNQSSIHTVFCTFIDNRPHIYERSFRPQIINGKLEISIERNDAIGRNNELFYYGQFSALEQFARSNISFIRTETDTTVVGKLISVQILATPKAVNGPIDIVRLTRSGINWIKRKKECR